MPEEETGFTFVDKRRVAVESPADLPGVDLPGADLPGETSVAEEDPIAVSPEEASDLAGAGPAPSTYDLIGYCINLLAQQAWQKLGLLADPQTGEAQPDLDDAKVAIDTLGDLAARMDTAPAGVLPAEVRRDLRTLLNDLRLNYVSQRGTSGA